MQKEGGAVRLACSHACGNVVRYSSLSWTGDLGAAIYKSLIWDIRALMFSLVVL